MKRTILTAALSLALAGTAAFAQQPAPTPDAQQPPPKPHHAPNPQHEAKHLSKVLNLTPDQTAKLEPILADRDQKMEALRSNTTLAPKEMHQQMRAIQQDTQQQLSGVLTPDQLQQMKAMRHEHGPHGGPNQAQPTPPPPSA
jgi:Spy/CpxP family protein refolding chaperone